MNQALLRTKVRGQTLDSNSLGNGECAHPGIFRSIRRHLVDDPKCLIGVYAMASVY